MIKNQEFAGQLLEMMESLLAAAEQIYSCICEGNSDLYTQLSDDMYNMIVGIQAVADDLKEEENGLILPAAIASVRASLVRASYFQEKDPAIALQKIEYELIPLIEEMRGNFYFWSCVYPDKEKLEQYYKQDIFRYFRNYYTEEAEKTGEYKYEMSVVVIAYNKIEYTKMCLENLLKDLQQLPEEITYELILINHGSTDGTKEFFEQVGPHKQMDIEVNGGGMEALRRIMEGKYFLSVSNDVIVPPGAIENLYKCITSDESIAWVVPSTSNISNCQMLPSMEYSSLEEFFKKAEENNVSDPYRWEERVRLVNPIDIRRNGLYTKIPDNGYIFSRNLYAFPDDRTSFLYRKNGYKLLLAKDAFCHHFGSVTIKDGWSREEDNKVYTQGRLDFREIFGVDPWGTGFCYAPELFDVLPCDKKGTVHVLGVNCGLGSTPLKIKETYKEKHHNTDVFIYNYTQDESVLEAVKSVSDKAELFCGGIKWEADVTAFDYIVIEQGLESLEDLKVLRELFDRLKPEGYMVVMITEGELRSRIEESFAGVREANSIYTDRKYLYWKKGE